MNDKVKTCFKCGKKYFYWENKIIENKELCGSCAYEEYFKNEMS